MKKRPSPPRGIGAKIALVWTIYVKYKLPKMWGLALYALEPTLTRRLFSFLRLSVFVLNIVKHFKNSKTFTFGYSIEIANFYFAK